MSQRGISPAAVIFLAGSSQRIAFQTDIAAGAYIRASWEAAAIKVITIAEVVPVIIMAVRVTLVTIMTVRIMTVLVTMVVTVLDIGCLGQRLS